MLARNGRTDIISGMRRLRLDDLVRVAGGVALLALLAVQENVWPSLLTPPVKPEKRDAEPADTDSPESDSSTTDSAPGSFKRALPDIGPARWAAGFDALRGVADGGRYSGVYACGPLNSPDQPTTEAAPIPLWRMGIPAVPPLVLGKPASTNTPLCFRDPALRTVLIRTGPPTA